MGVCVCVCVCARAHARALFLRDSKFSKTFRTLQALQFQDEVCLFRVIITDEAKAVGIISGTTYSNILMFPRKNWGEPRRISEC